MIGSIVAALLASASPQALQHRDLAVFPFPAPLLTVAAASGGGGATAQPYYTAENLLGAASGSGPVSVLTLSLSAAQQQASTKYLGIWSCDNNALSATSTADISLSNGTTTLGSAHHTSVSSSPWDKASAGGFFIHDAGSVPASVTFSLTAGTGSNSTVYNSRISLLKLGANDTYTESLAQQSNSGTSMVTAATHSFTPPSTGDYVVLVSFEQNVNAATPTYCQWLVTDGTTSIGTYRVSDHNSGSDWFAVMAILPLSAVSATKTITVQHSTALSGNASNIRNIRIVAIRCDRFANVYANALGTDNAGTETSYTVAQSQTNTLAAADHLVIGAAQINTSGGNAYAKLSDGSVDFNETIAAFKNTASNRNTTSFAHRLASYSGSTTFSWQRKGSGSVTVTVRGATAIAAFNLAGLI